MCYPTAAPFLVTLSTVDVSETEPGWHCDKLDVETVLQEGERFLYYLSRVLRWL